MTVFVRAVLGGAFALALVGSAFAGDVAPAATPAATAAQDPAAAEHEKLMKETVCRSLDEDDTGHHVHHRTCMTRADWQAYDKKQKSGYDPDSGRVVVKE